MCQFDFHTGSCWGLIASAALLNNLLKGTFAASVSLFSHKSDNTEISLSSPHQNFNTGTFNKTFRPSFSPDCASKKKKKSGIKTMRFFERPACRG